MSDPDFVMEEIEKAEKALDDARILQDQEGSRQSIASLLYYACYHSAKAVIYDRGFDPETHGGVVSLFGQHVMDGEKVKRDDARFLSRSQTRREKTEYDYQPVQEDLEELLNRTESFVLKMKDLVS